MSSRLDYEGMAPSELALAYYARWEGPVRESADPYPRPGESPPYLRAIRHLQEALFLPRRDGPLDNDAVKWAVMTHGGVDAAVDFRVQSEFTSWNESTHAYYNATRSKPNHHILCVGWDDAFPASRFLEGSRPPGDGAFLIKNSWGTDYADKGYLWVSYYDATFGDALAVFSGVEPASNFDAVYQYDALGRSAWIDAGAGELAWFANRFTAAGSGQVAAVSFYTPVPGTAYEVRVAGRLQEVGAAPVAAAGTVAVAGYHTVRLERPAAVTAGQVFVVAVRVVAPGWGRPVPVEAPSDLIAPRARAGQSYVGSDGAGWFDLTRRTGLSRANVCLKAFVNAAGAADTRAPRVADPRRRGAARRPGRDPLASRGPGLFQRKRDRRAAPARRRRQTARPPPHPRRRGGRARGVDSARDLAAGPVQRARPCLRRGGWPPGDRDSGRGRRQRRGAGRGGPPALTVGAGLRGAGRVCGGPVRPPRHRLQ